MSRPPYFSMPNDLPTRMANTVPMDAAMLNVTTWSHASQWVNDGVIPLQEARRLPGWTPKRHRKLVTAGLWTEADGRVRSWPAISMSTGLARPSTGTALNARQRVSEAALNVR